MGQVIPASGNSSLTQLNNAGDIAFDTPSQNGQFKANMNSQWSITGQVAGQKGRNDYGDLSGSLLVRYS